MPDAPTAARPDISLFHVKQPPSPALYRLVASPARPRRATLPNLFDHAWSSAWKPAANRSNRLVAGARDSEAGQDGLTQTEAQDRLEQFGAEPLPGTTAPRRRGASCWSISATRWCWILLLASGISALTGEVTNFVIIAAIVLLSVTLDFVQERRASARRRPAARVGLGARQRAARRPAAGTGGGAAGAGRHRAARGWRPWCRPTARVLQARDFFVNQALLTGESHPVEKSATRRAPDASDLLAAGNAVFMGSSVVSGSAAVRVVRTGGASAMGGIAQNLDRAPAPTAFELGTRQFGLLIMRLTLLMVGFVLLVNLLSHKPWLESFLFAVALAVGLTPELLPMVVSVTLARRAAPMAQQQIIVKRQARSRTSARWTSSAPTRPAR